MKTKWLYPVTLVAAFGLLSCSDDSSSSSSDSASDTATSDSSSSTASSGSTTSSTDDTQMACNEIMYHYTTDLEWIEISIASGSALESMSAKALRLDGAVEFNFPDEPLAVDERIVVTNDVELFNETYPSFSGRLFGPWDVDDDGEVERLSNSGDVVSVKISGNGDVDCTFENDPPWPSLADGNGHSLVYIGGNAALYSSWAASALVGGNPGSADDEVYSSPEVRINELNPTDGSNDWIEFYNMGSSSLDISGWSLIAKKRGDTLTIPDGSVIAAGGYLVLDQSALGSDMVFLSRGENLYLREMVNDEWTYIETGIEYPASPDATVGVLELSDGGTVQGSLAEATQGAANETTPNLGPLYLNEIYYNPPDGALEFLEIINLADSAVSLAEGVNGTSGTWEISGIGDASLSDVVVPAGGLLLLMPDTSLLDTAEYRAGVGISDDVVIRVYSGKISNRGEQLTIKQPYTYVASSTSATKDWYYRWSDVALYSDDWEGLEEADGGGKSLQRVSYTTSGSDPAAWEVATPSPGQY